MHNGGENLLFPAFRRASDNLLKKGIQEAPYLFCSIWEALSGTGEGSPSQISRFMKHMLVTKRKFWFSVEASLQALITFLMILIGGS